MEQQDPFFHLIVVSDFSPESAGPFKARGIDKDSLDAWLKELSPQIEVVLGGARSRLSLQEFRDFRPERLSARVAALSNLVDLKKQAKELAAGSGSVESVRACLARLGDHPGLVASFEKALSGTPGASPSPSVSPSPPRPDVPQGSLFDLVDVESTPRPEPEVSEQAQSNAQRLIDAVLRTSSSEARPTAAALREVGAKAEEALAPMLRELLRNPRFRDLEAAWRGLRLLVRSMDFRAGCRLHAIAAPRAALLQALKGSAFALADDLRSQGRTACLLLDFEFEGSENDLQAIAREAGKRSLPVLASARPDRVFRKSPEASDDAREGWMRLRSDSASRWLALAANRFVLRAPYGAQTDPVKDFAFEEFGEPDSSPCWGRPGWLLAALVAASAARTGWGTEFSGRQTADVFEALPLRPGEEMTTPLEFDLTEGAAQSVLEAGFLPLACRRGHDQPFAAGTATVYQALKEGPASSLRHALFSAQMAAAIDTLLGRIDRTCSLEEIARTLGAGLQILGLQEGGALFEASATPLPGDRPGVALRVRPRGGPLRGISDFVLDVPIDSH